MKNISVQMATVVFAISVSAPQLVHAADNVAATVNAQPIKRAWLDTFRKSMQAAGGKTDDKVILSNLIKNELLAQEATRLGIDKQENFATLEEMRHRELLANLLVNDYLKKNPVSEEMVKAEYERSKIQMGNKEYNARHIQLQTEAEAKDVIAQLAKGADFAKLAKEKSQDANTKDKGGELGWFAKGTITPPLGDAAAKLQKGLFTTMPLHSKAGWHVLKLEDVRDPPFDKVKDQLRQGLRTQQVNKLIDDLRAKAKIEIAK